MLVWELRRKSAFYNTEISTLSFCSESLLFFCPQRTPPWATFTSNTIKTKHVDVQWDPQSTNVSATAQLVIPGSKTDDQPVMNVYTDFDSSRLEGVRDLRFSGDAELHLFGMSNSMAFNGYAKPIAERLLEREANKLAGGKQIRNVHIGGSNIQKGNAEKALLGLYRVRYQYNGSEYSFWSAGDGMSCWHDKPLPPDAKRQKKYDTLLEEASVEPKSASLYGCVHAVFGVIGLFTFGIGWLGNVVLERNLHCYCPVFQKLL